MNLFVYDPATNMLEDRGIIVPDLVGETRRMALAPDGLIYMRFGRSSTRSILSFDPASGTPGLTVASVLSKAELEAGPAGSATTMNLSWYDGNLAFHTSTGGLYAIPEPASIGFLDLGGLLLLRRRR